MVKSVKKKANPLAGEKLKSPKEASTIFHNIMKASVTVGFNTPKPKTKKATKK